MISLQDQISSRQISTPAFYPPSVTSFQNIDGHNFIFRINDSVVGQSNFQTHYTIERADERFPSSPLEEPSSVVANEQTVETDDPRFPSSPTELHNFAGVKEFTQRLSKGDSSQNTSEGINLITENVSDLFEMSKEHMPNPDNVGLCENGDINDVDDSLSLDIEENNALALPHQTNTRVPNIDLLCHNNSENTPSDILSNTSSEIAECHQLNTETGTKLLCNRITLMDTSLFMAESCMSNLPNDNGLQKDYFYGAHDSLQAKHHVASERSTSKTSVSDYYEINHDALQDIDHHVQSNVENQQNATYRPRIYGDDQNVFAEETWKHEAYLHYQVEGTSAIDDTQCSVLPSFSFNGPQIEDFPSISIVDCQGESFPYFSHELQGPQSFLNIPGTTLEGSISHRRCKSLPMCRGKTKSEVMEELLQRNRMYRSSERLMNESTMLEKIKEIVSPRTSRSNTVSGNPSEARSDKSVSTQNDVGPNEKSDENKANYLPRSSSYDNIIDVKKNTAVCAQTSKPDTKAGFETLKNVDIQNTSHCDNSQIILQRAKFTPKLSSQYKITDSE